MRWRLGVLSGGLLLALMALNVRARSSPTPLVATTGSLFRSPVVLWDGSAYRDRMYPHYADFDGDGRTDQLVGVGDRLLVFRNTGSNQQPRWSPPFWFDAVEPSARIPAG